MRKRRLHRTILHELIFSLEYETADRPDATEALHSRGPSPPLSHLEDVGRQCALHSLT